MAGGIDKLALILLRDGKILCARSRGNDAYYMPGGKREAGETDVQALAREIREELCAGLVPASLKFFGVFEAQAHGRAEGTTVRITCYTGELSGEPKPANEIEEIAWLAYADRGKTTPAGYLIFDRLKEAGMLL